MRYKKVRSTCDGRSKWKWKNSKLNDAEHLIASEEKEMRQAMMDMNALTISSSEALSLSGMRRVLDKMEMLNQLMTKLLSFSQLVEKQMRQLEVRVAQMMQLNVDFASEYVVDCVHDCKFSWEEAFDHLAKLLTCPSTEHGRNSAPLSLEEVVSCGLLLSKCYPSLRCVGQYQC